MSAMASQIIGVSIVCSTIFQAQIKENIKALASVRAIHRSQSISKYRYSLHWRHNERDGVSNHQHLDCLLNRLFRWISKKISKLHVTGLCEGKPPGTSGFPPQRASNAKKYPIDDVIMYHDKIMRNINVVIFYGIYCISLSSPSAMTIDSRFSG